MPCIEFLTKEGTNGFQCPVCENFHEQPKKGYLKNPTLAKLCDKKANKVYRSSLGKAFEAQLDELKQSMDKLALENDLGADKIKEYYEDLRNEVQLHLEELIESLKKQSSELIRKIDEYEIEAALKFDAYYNIEMDDFLSETRRFHEKWADYLKQFEINKEELKLASLETKKLQHKLNKESDLFLSKLFRFNLAKFEKSAPPHFGRLVNEAVKQSYIQTLHGLNDFHLGAKVDCKNITKCSIKPLSNGTICIAYFKHQEAGLWIEVWDKDVNRLHNAYKNHSVYGELQLVELNQAIVLCLFDFKTGDQGASLSAFVKYDLSLNYLSHKSLLFEINYADVHQDKLYLLARSSDGNSRHIYVYDESLEMLENIQLGISEGLPFYTPKSVTRMTVAEKYFVFLNGTNVLLMDRLDGEIKQTFCINNIDFVLDSRNDRIMAYDAELGKLVCFDFQGESFEISWAKLKTFELFDFVHDKFMFFKPDSFFAVF
jgi:hypothetical protein